MCSRGDYLDHLFYLGILNMSFGLTALPAPDIIKIPDYDEILKRVVSRLRTINEDYTSIVEGDPAYAIMQSIIFEIVMILQRINDAARAVLVTHSIGADLDNVGALFAIYRQVIQHEDLTADPPIPEILENDNRFRDRIINALEAIVPGSRAWYRGYALESSSMVKDAIALKTNPGEVTVYVQADNTTAVPDSALLTTVSDYITAEARKFICDTVIVSAIGIRSYALTASIKPTLGLDKNTVLADIQKRAEDFANERKVIGKPIPLSHIYAALITDAVSEIDLSAPVSNIVPTNIEVPVASSVTITLGI